MYKDLKEKFAFTLGATHVENCHNDRRIAFTLAEVLITLGIIGIVSALTIPTLIKKFNAIQTASKLQQAHSLLNNAYKLSVIDNGIYEQWKIGRNAEVYINTYFLPYFKNAKICTNYQECGYDSKTPFKGTNNAAMGAFVARNDLRLPLTLPNGTYLIIAVGSGNSDNTAIIKSTAVFIDLNGGKKPNRLCEDLFVYQVNNKGIKPYDSCTPLIMKNGWKIPKNYSTKFNIESF